MDGCQSCVKFEIIQEVKKEIIEYPDKLYKICTLQGIKYGKEANEVKYTKEEKKMFTILRTY